MSITLAEMVSQVQAAIGASSEAFTLSDIHRAIIAAGNHYHGEVRPANQATNISLSMGVTSVDVTATIPGFVQDDLFGQEAYINQQPVRLIGYQKIARRLQGTPATGQPTRMAFLADDALFLDVETDAAYTLVVPHVARLTTFTPGTTSSVTLNIPSADAARLAYTGCVWYLLKGSYDDQAETQNALLGFRELIEQAKQRFPSSRAAVIDRQVKT